MIFAEYCDYKWKDEDWKIIRDFRFDLSSTVSYCPYRSYIFWSDELDISNLSTLGQECVTNALDARAYLYHRPQSGLYSEIHLTESEMKDYLSDFRMAFPDWPGLKRFQLSKKEVEMFRRHDLAASCKHW